MCTELDIQSSRHRLSSHRPVMFLSNRNVPSTPPSLVKFILIVSSSMTGALRSTPISDQVPQLMKAHP